MVALPALTAVTTPVPDTVATDVFDDDHANVTAELGGLADAVSWSVEPIATDAVDGDTEIDLTLLGAFFARLGAAGSPAGPEVSEQAPNAKAAPATALAISTTIR
jgi:hypothetical protein